MKTVTTSVSQVKVRPEVWEIITAWVDSKGLTRNCIEIVSENEAIAHNHPIK